MRFGINTFLWTVKFGPEQAPLLEKIKAGGFDGAEIALFDPAEFDAPGIRRVFADHGLGLTVCSVMTKDTNPVSESAAVRQAARDHLQASVAKVAEAGAEILAGPLYAPLGDLPGRRRTSEEWGRALEFYQSMGPVLDQHGVTIAIEPLNRFETYFLNTAADAAEFCRQVNHPRVGVLFDTFHANIEEKSIADGYRTVGPYLKHVHTCENDRGTPGSGHVDWAGVFQALSDVNYDGWLTIESFGSAIAEIAAAACIWRDLEKSSEALAFEGLRFLQTKVS
jgi:D-psicose/D-tagatose/L-ribulose 3-epimerase